VTPWVTRLLIANVVVFFLQMTMPGLDRMLAFVPDYAFSRPWTIITYQFVHAQGNITHILFNMLGLYFFGPRVETRLGSDHFIALYLLSGIGGALLSFFFAHNAAIVGASGAVFGVMLAFARFWPREQILLWGIIPIEARILIMITTAMALWSGYNGSRSGVADFAHLGGFVGAFLYLQWFERRTGAKKFKQRIVEKVTDPALLNWQKVDPKQAHEVNRDELNRILDKIGRHGLNSLSDPEKQFLSNFVPPMQTRVPPPPS
jgi:membrane associated rhomboid family serine protease